MKYFTKKWYKASLERHEEPQAAVHSRGIVGRLKKRRRQNEDTTMIDYQRQLAKIEHKLPECIRSTFHDNLILSVHREQDALVIDFDNTQGFSDIEKLVLHDAAVTEEECDPVGKTWLYEEVTMGGGGFILSVLLGDDSGGLYYYTVHFVHAECVVTDYTESTEAGIAETLESICALCAEEAGLNYDEPEAQALIRCLKNIASYRIADKNLYRFEAGVYNHACEELYELVFTRLVYARNGIFQLTICFFYPPDAVLEECSDTICSDIFKSTDAFFDAVAASDAFCKVMRGYKPIKVQIHAQQI